MVKIKRFIKISSHGRVRKEKRQREKCDLELNAAE